MPKELSWPTCERSTSSSIAKERLLWKNTLKTLYKNKVSGKEKNYVQDYIPFIGSATSPSGCYIQTKLVYPFWSFKMVEGYKNMFFFWVFGSQSFTIFYLFFIRIVLFKLLSNYDRIELLILRPLGMLFVGLQMLKNKSILYIYIHNIIGISCGACWHRFSQSFLFG